MDKEVLTSGLVLSVSINVAALTFIVVAFVLQAVRYALHINWASYFRDSHMRSIVRRWPAVRNSSNYSCKEKQLVKVVPNKGNFTDLTRQPLINCYDENERQKAATATLITPPVLAGDMVVPSPSEKDETKSCSHQKIFPPPYSQVVREKKDQKKDKKASNKRIIGLHYLDNVNASKSLSDIVKFDSQRVIDFLIRMFASASSIYVLFSHDVLYYRHATMTSSHSDENGVVFLLYSAYAGLVIVRLVLNVLLRPRLEGVFFLLATYDVVLAVTLCFIVFGRMLEIIGAALLVAECSTLLSEKKTDAWRRRSRDSFLTSVIRSGCGNGRGDEEKVVGFGYSSPIVLKSTKIGHTKLTTSSTTSSLSAKTTKQLQATLRASEKRASCWQRFRVAMRNCWLHVFNVLTIFLCKLLLPVILLTIASLRSSAFSLSPLPLCVFTYSLTFFGAFHIFALIHQIIELKRSASLKNIILSPAYSFA